MRILCHICASFFFLSCTVPDLSDPEVFSEAKVRAVELQTLERKFMFGMFHLYVHEDDRPFTGWVKTTGDTSKVKQLGFLKKGRKEGVWMDWYSGGNKKSQIVWAKDRMEGSFTVWHPNGKIEMVGQTRDGEVDGEWKEYYSNGTLACQSTNRTGHLVNLMVWKPDGSRCQQSKVSQGKGSFVRYFEDGSIEHIRTFTQGVETSREIFHQR